MTKSGTIYTITSNGIKYTSEGESLKESMEMALQFSEVELPDHMSNFFASMAYECLHVQGMDRASYEVSGINIKITKG